MTLVLDNFLDNAHVVVALLVNYEYLNRCMSVSASTDSDVLDVAFVSGKKAKALYKTQVK